MANFRVLFLCAALIVGCALVFPRSAASMGGKPVSPATSDIQAGSDGPSKPAADSAEAYDTLGQLIAGGDVALAAEHVARQDGKRSRGRCAL